jgi:hypothetical protein
MNQKTNIHASSYNCPRLAFHLSTREQDSQVQETFTKAETQLHKILQKVGANSPIGAAIHIGLSRPGAFRKLIKELKDQQRDAPAMLEKIIGRNGIEVLRMISNR